MMTYARCAPYTQYNVHKMFEPPASVLRVYPGAFFVNQLEANTKSDGNQAACQEVGQSRRHRFFFSSWWPSPENARVQGIRHANKTGSSAYR